MPNWKKLIVSGSDASLSSLSAATYISASSFSGNLTGSVFGTSSWAISASFAITSSYGLNPNISGSLNNVDAVIFNTASSIASAPGVLTWDNGEGTLQLGLVGGNVDYKVGEDLYQYVYNAQGTALSKGQVVYASGSQGGRIAVKLASATAELGSANTIGIVAESITAGAEGWIITEGTLKNINTSQFTTSPFAYLSSSAGEFTPNYPEAPQHGVRLGIVQKVDATTGALYVKIDNGYELEELHDVIDSTTTSSFGDLLVKSGSVWYTSKQLTGSYRLTGSLIATTINTSYLTASGLNYPTADGIFNGQVLQTNAAGTLSFGNVNAVFETIYNGEATTLTKGTVVYASGSLGSSPIVYRADTSNPNRMPVTFVVAENIATASTGRGVTLGLITGIDVTGYSVGDLLWVDGNGTLTTTRPTGSSDIVQPIAVVTKPGVGGQINILNPGPVLLPNIQSGYTWIGNNINYPTAIATSSIQNVVSSSFASTASSADNFLVRGTLTAQTIVAQTITSSTDFVTGSTRFGSLLSNTHQFTGSVSVTGSLTSPNITGSLLGTASYVSQALSSSYALTASYASMSLYQLTNVSASGAVDGQPLVYDGASLKWVNWSGGPLNVSITGSAGTATSASYAATASYILQAVSASLATTSSYSITSSYTVTSSYAETSSYSATASFANTGFTINTTSYYVTSSNTTAGTTTVSSVATSSFTSVFYNYTIRSGSNARSGQMMSVWSGSSIQYTEVTTIDIGSTSTASLAVALSGNNVNLNFTAPGIWTVKSIANLL